MNRARKGCLGWGLIIAVVILLIVTLSGGRVFGQDKPVKPLRDFMFAPPNSVYGEYGFSEDTFRFFNMIKLREACQLFEAQIAALRAEVDELKKLVAELTKPIDPTKRIKLEGADPVVITGNRFLDPNAISLEGGASPDADRWPSGHGEDYRDEVAK